MNRIIMIACFTMLTACVPQTQWRTKSYYSPAPPAPTAATLPVTCPTEKLDKVVESRFVIPPDLSKCRIYSLAFVEFKNSGEMAQSEQLTEALHAIDDADQRSHHHALVITFIHGWKNNARQENNNVNDFRRELNGIAQKACKGAESQCGVTGIYLAWNGDLVSRYSNTLRTVSIFNRARTAQQVALEGQPPLTMTLAPIGDTLFKIMKRVKSGSGDLSKSNHSVVVGHSLGGLILEFTIYSQLEQIGRELAASTSSAALTDFADLVVLINQATPADHAVNLMSQYLQEGLNRSTLRQPCWDNSSIICAHPLVLSVASTTDLATKTVLPVTEALGLMPSNDRLPIPEALPIDSTTVYHTATAHANQLQSHILNPGVCIGRTLENIPVHITLPAYAPTNATPSGALAAAEQIDYCVTPVSMAWDNTPYWAFEIPTEVVPDHGTIFTDRFVDFLKAFLPPLGSYNPMAPPPPPRMLAQPAQPRQNR